MLRASPEPHGAACQANPAAAAAARHAGQGYRDTQRHTRARTDVAVYCVASPVAVHVWGNAVSPPPSLRRAQVAPAQAVLESLKRLSTALAFSHVQPTTLWNVEKKPCGTCFCAITSQAATRRLCFKSRDDALPHVHWQHPCDSMGSSFALLSESCHPDTSVARSVVPAFPARGFAFSVGRGETAAPHTGLTGLKL